MDKKENRFNVEQHTTLDNKIIDVFPISHRYIHELEQQVKKQKEAINKLDKYLHTRGIQQWSNGMHYRGLDGLQVQVLEDILNEVSE